MPPTDGRFLVQFTPTISGKYKVGSAISYACATQSPVLTRPYCGTKPTVLRQPCTVLTMRMVPRGVRAVLGPAHRGFALQSHVSPATCLRTRCALPGTDIPYAATRVQQSGAVANQVCSAI
eukprot:2828407-Rhodomonas_salina.7